MNNLPGEWKRQWHDGSLSGVHPTFPTDGRETLYPPYEREAPTDTVADYLRAAFRAHRNDPDLPPDYNAYLTQRVPTTLHFGTAHVPLESTIDAHGFTTPPPAE